MKPLGYVTSCIKYSNHARESRKFILKYRSIPARFPAQEVTQAA
jgi:hypothetical protein